MGLHECQVCGRKYRSSQWLSRHVEAKHGAPTDNNDENLSVAAQDTTEARECSQTELQEGSPAKAKPSELLASACDALGVRIQDVLSFRVYEDRVVLVEGPAGRKRTWARKEDRWWLA